MAPDTAAQPRSRWAARALIAALAAAAAAASIISYQSFEASHRLEAQQQLTAIVELKQDEVSGWRAERLGAEAEILRESSRFAQDANAVLSRPDDEQAALQVRSWLASYRAHLEYTGAALLATDGREIVSDGARRSPLAPEVIAQVPEVARTRTVTMVDFYRGGAGGQPELAVLIPIAGPRPSQQAAAVVVLQVDPGAKLYPLLAAWPTPSASAEMLLARREGDQLVVLNPTRSAPDGALRLRLPLAAEARAAIDSSPDRPVVISMPGDHGQPALMAVHPMPGTPWLLVAQVDRAEVDAPLRERLWQTALFFGLLAGAVVASLSLLWRRRNVQEMRRQLEAAAALRESEVRFRALIEHAPGAITLVGADGRLTFASESTERWMGYPPAEIIGRDPAELTHPEDLPRVLGALGELMAVPGAVRTLGYRFRHRDGSWRWVESTVSNLLHEPGVRALAFNFQDITERVRADQALRASEELYRGLMESLDSAVMTVDADGTLLYLNDVAARVLGGAPHELVGRRLGELLTPPPSPEHMALLAECIRTNTAAERELLSTLQGGPRWLRVTIQPIRDGGGRVSFALINALDIHDLKATQQELLQLNQTLEQRVRERAAEVQDLFDYAPTGYHSLDAEGRIARINQTELDWLGYGRDEVLGRSFADFLTPASRAVFERTTPTFIATGQVRELELQICRRGGASFPVMLNATAVYDAGGAYVMSRSTMFDITQRKAAELALRESEAQNRLLFDASPEAIALLDSCGVVVRANDALERLLGAPSEELAGHGLGELGQVAAEGAALLEAALAQALGSDDFAATELRLRCAGGEVRDVEVRAFGLLLRGAQHYLAALRDITAEKQAAAALRRANEELARAARAKDEFLANMSHELRTPLNAILGFGESMQEQVYGALAPRQQDAMRHIVASGRHLLALINDILDLSKVEAGRLELHTAPVDVAELCQASLLFVREQAARKQIHVGLHVDDHTLAVEADPVRLKQMLVNLLSNAVKFTPEGGTVTLEAGLDGEGGVRFAVRDTGIGIAPEDMARLFQPFSQLDSSLSRQFEGTGLGLALVRRMADLHGGSCTAESAPGEGSCFTVRLPYRSPSTRMPAAAAPPAPEPPAGPAPRLGRVLLVDDNEESLQVTGSYLEARGYAVTLARNGVEAIEAAVAGRPDVILMDIQMPAMDGLEAIRRLRALPAVGGTPVVALTALAMPGDRERCLAAGASEYVTKPVSLRGLVTTIEGLRGATGAATAP